MKMTIRELRRKYQAIDTLSGRALPGYETELKIATLLRMYLSKPYKISDDLINKALKKFPIPEDHEGEMVPARIRDARGFETEAVQDLEIEVRDVPDSLKIKKADLPIKGKNLEQNHLGIGNIIASLGPELYDDFDETEEKAYLEAPATQEPVSPPDAVHAPE